MSIEGRPRHISIKDGSQTRSESPFAVNPDHLVKEVYSLWSKEWPNAQVDPTSRYCTSVNEIAHKELRDQGVRSEFLAHDKDGVVRHAFVTIDEDKKEILDLQYQQFVPEADRDGLPDYMHFPFATEQDVVDGLIEHKIPPRWHEYWIEEMRFMGKFPQRFSTFRR